MLKIESLDQNNDEGLDGVLDEDTRIAEAEKIYGTAEEVEISLDRNAYQSDGDDDAEYMHIQADPEVMRITRLAPGLRDQNRVNVFINGRFVFSLDVVQTVDYHLKVGMQVTQEKFAELKEASEFGKLYARTLEWCMTRPHSIFEAKVYLRQRQFRRKVLNQKREAEEKRPLEEISEKNTQLVLDRLIEKKFLDDKVFAKFYVENRYLRKGISQRKLSAELMKKGVAKEIINEALHNSPRVEEEEIAKVVAKKRAKYNDRGLLNYLMRQGFSYQAAKKAVDDSSTESLYKYDY